jgi:RNA polymerase sigma-70 factor (ECF subfamily)
MHGAQAKILSTQGDRRTVTNGFVYLRLVRTAPPEPVSEHECVQAFDREFDYVFAALRRLGAPPSDIEDLAHDVFVVLLRNWAKLDTERPLRPYLFGVAYRIVCAHRRRRLREVPHPAPDSEDAGPGPETSLQSHEAAALLQTALERVPLARRAVIIMHELDGIPITEVAAALSISRFGAYARLHKGLKELAAAARRLELRGVER